MRSVYEMSETAWKTFHLSKNKILNPITKYFFKSKNSEFSNLPRQKLPKTFFGQGYVDIIKTSILNKKKLYGDKCLGFITPDVGEVDNFNDLEKIRNDKNFKKI